MKDNTIRTALISVTDKTGLEQFAGVLKDKGVKILSSSGTMKFLKDHGIDAEEIAVYTDSPELLGGRVKTLHPKIHAGILADRSNPSHMSDLDNQGILPIDLVVVNLYPFKEKFKAGGLSPEELTEFIDIGGITLIRAAAKNHQSVSVLTDVNQYEAAKSEIAATGATTLETRRKLAKDAFSLTSSYDAAIETFFHGITPEERTPQRLNFALNKVTDLRYGENPHQFAALYEGLADSPLLAMTQHQGKELSFNNYLDLVAAFALARDIGKGGVTINKHTNPCGVAWCHDAITSYHRALSTDRISAFGGIVAINDAINNELAEELKQLFLEVIVARSVDADAMQTLSKKKNLRILTVPDSYWEKPGTGYFSLLIDGVFLVQDMDSGFPELDEVQVASKRQPTAAERTACEMAWKVAKHVKSNAIVIADTDGSVGIGAGQMSRLDASQIATRKAFDAKFSLMGKVAASDAFFPFPDGVKTLAETGISAIIQPGGSIRDQEVIDAADDAKIAMLLTGRRHFRHV